MNQDHIARVAAENATRKELLRFMLLALSSLRNPQQTPAGNAALHRQLIAAVQQLKGELIAPFQPSDAPMDHACNAAVRQVIADFEAQFAAALNGQPST